MSSRTWHRAWRWTIAVLLAIALVAIPAAGHSSLAKSKVTAKKTTTTKKAAPKAATYTNPLIGKISGGGKVESCADPSIIYVKKQKTWYVYCTSDALNATDPSGHTIPILKSTDLAHFTYVHDAMTAPPSWVQGAGVWAPDIHYMNGKYYIYFTAPETTTAVPGGGSNISAIGVVTSKSPTGPFKNAGVVVEPHAPPCCPDAKMWTFDPAVVSDGGQKYIFYGSYYGGIQARKLSADGLHSDPASQTQITIDNHYEGAFVVKHNGYWYLFASSGPCCNVGPLSGYTVFVGRSQNVLGPYVDKDGHSMLEGRTGGHPFIYSNGNGFTGTGHNAVFQDLKGQWWTVYHAIQTSKPYLQPPATDVVRRPLMIDPVDWVDDWPELRGGLGPSNTKMPAPAAQPGEKDLYKMTADTPPALGNQLPNLSDDFNGSTLSSQWTWERPPATGTYSVSDGNLRWTVQDGDLYQDRNDASVLQEAAPSGNYMVEVKVKMTFPAEGCCWNYQQGGFVIMKDDDNYVRATSASEWGTRYVEFGKEWNPAPIIGGVHYGAGWWSPVGDWTYIRVYKTGSGATEKYTLYLSVDGTNYRREWTWAHDLGSAPKIGLVSMGRDPSQNPAVDSLIDYIHVYQLAG